MREGRVNLIPPSTLHKIYNRDTIALKKEDIAQINCIDYVVTSDVVRS